MLRNVLWIRNFVEESPTRVQCITGVKGHAGVSQSQPDVKLLGNPQWLPNLVTRTPEHRWL